MPITAKLSRKFYETFGDDIANEFVAWFNSVDAQYSMDLQAMLDQRFAAQDARIEQRLAAVIAKLDQCATRAELAEKIGGLRQELRDGLANLRAELIKWSFVFFATAALAVIGLR